MPPVDQYTQPDPPRATQVKKSVHGGPDRAARVENIIDDDQIAVVDRELYVV